MKNERAVFRFFFAMMAFMRRANVLPLFFIFCFFSGVPVLHAKDLVLVPVPALSSDQYTILSNYASSADGTIEGAGGKIRISYAAGMPLHGYVAIMSDDWNYNPADMYSFQLPAAEDGIAIVDLTALTTWTPSKHRYYLSFLTTAENSDAQFKEMALLQPTAVETIGAAFRHFLTLEPYWVSSAHLLRGYRVLNTPFVNIEAFILLVTVFLIFVLKRFRNISSLFSVLLVLSFFYTARFTTDFTILSIRHLHEWFTVHTYAQAGDLYSVADLLKTESKKSSQPLAVSVCFSSTDYYAKLLRYLVYPMPVTMTGTLLPATTHVVVSHDLQWSESGSILHCGGIHQKAAKIKSFSDGTLLYSITRD